MQSEAGSDRTWRALKATAKSVIAGALGGALSGALIVVVPERAFDAAALVAAIFGSLFGIVAFPLCYMILVRDVPLWLVFVCAIPATVAGEIGFIELVGGSVPINSFFRRFFRGWFWRSAPDLRHPSSDLFDQAEQSRATPLGRGRSS